jgi:hypothetical protein
MLSSRSILVGGVLADRDRGRKRDMSSCPYSPNLLEKSPERVRGGPQHSPTDHPKAVFVLRIPANSTVGALLIPLFRESLCPTFGEAGINRCTSLKRSVIVVPITREQTGRSDDVSALHYW